VGTSVALDSQPLLVFKQFRHPTGVALATLHNASMRGVGTELGTIEAFGWRAVDKPLGSV
jgi:hypothetical protein